MKRFVLIFVLTLFAFSTWAQLPSSCNVPEILKSNYEFDVGHLTFKWLHDTQSPDTSLIEIPQWAQEPIWEGLAAIYNRHDIIEVDSLFNKYCVHNSLVHSIISQSIWVRVDTSFAWTKNWAHLQTLTGIQSLDSILAKYKFTLTFYYQFQTSSWADAKLTTDLTINVIPICNFVRNEPGVHDCNPSVYAGDGNKIEYEYSGDSKLYTFTMAWGDCPLGCTSSHTWRFKVNSDCSFDFLGIENSIIDLYYPVPSNCNLSASIPIQPNMNSVITILPNPASDYQTIMTNLDGKLSYTLFDNLGNKLLTGTFEKKIVIDVRILPRGLYFILFQQGERNLISKKLLIE